MSIRSRARVPAAAGSERLNRAPAQAWYRQGIVWLGGLVFALSVAGSLWLLDVAVRYADPPLPLVQSQLLKMPSVRPALPPQPPSAPAR